VTDNVASQLTTGSNSISENSFSNSSGIPIVIQNSGNNVLIQNSTILNLQLASPAK
jgi:parallel beta-helix repeat protein